MTIIKSIEDILKWIFSEQGSKAIYNLGLGFGAFFGGLAGLKIVFDWLANVHKQIRIRRYKRKYPIELHNEQGWETVFNPNRRGEIHVLDHRDKTRSWIANIDTFHDLGFPIPDNRDVERKNKSLDEYSEIPHILTTGRPAR